jgi:hypothetical protein
MRQKNKENIFGCVGCAAATENHLLQGCEVARGSSRRAIGKKAKVRGEAKDLQT